MREELKPGDKLYIDDTNKTLIIQSVIGKGATCIVYDAYYFDELGLNHNVRIKECFPIQYTQPLRKNGHIVWNDEQSKDKGINEFHNTYKKHLFFQNNHLFTNSTGKITDAIYEANNTKYIILDYFISNSFENIKNISIHEIIKIGISLTKLVLKYHEQGYLLLDLKPENFLVIKETSEMVFFIDFDSIQHMNNITHNDAIISYSPDWAAPELLQGRFDKIGYHTDIYAIGAILFSKIYHQKVTSRERRMNYTFSFDKDIFQELNPKAKYYFQWLFSHTLSNNPKRRFKNCHELLEVLEKLEYYTDFKNTYLQSTYIVQDNYFVGRKKELEFIDQFYTNEGHVIYLSGYGGIGKTELAKYYCHHHNYHFHTIVWLDYQGSIKNLIMDDTSFDIHNTNDYHFNSQNEKLSFLKHLVDKKTLIILDNYDQQDEDLMALLSLPCKMLITTRLQVKDLIDDQKSKVMNLNLLKEEECIHIFKHYYGGELPKSEMNYIIKLIQHFNRYSLIVPLLAKELRITDKLPSEKYDEIIKYGIKNSSETKINHVKDHNISKETTYQHILTIFNTASLSNEAKRMLYILSILGNIHISKTEISFYTGLIDNVDDIIKQDRLKYSLHDIVSKYKDKIHLETVNYLIEAGWLEYDEKLNMVMCHSIIREIIKIECAMPYSQLQFFSYYMMKVIYKLYYDCIEDFYYGISLTFNEQYPCNDIIPWDSWISHSYRLLVNEVLKNKLIVDEEDVYFYSKMLRYTYPYTTIELTDIALNILEKTKSKFPKSDVIIHMCISVLPFIIATKESLELPNQYLEDDQFVNLVESNIYTGYQLVEAKKEIIDIYHYLEEIVYIFYLLDCFDILEYSDKKLLDIFSKVSVEYFVYYEKIVNAYPEIKYENVHDFAIKRDIFNYNLKVKLDKYESMQEESDKVNPLTGSILTYESEDEEIEYDQSAYLSINNDNVDNLKENFLHHIYDYCFDLLLSDQVRTWYKEEQLVFESDNDSLEPYGIGDKNPYDPKKHYQCDKEFLVASYFLDQIPIANLGNRANMSVLINDLLDKNYYMVFKIIFLYFDAFNEKIEYEKSKPFEIDHNFMFLNLRMRLGRICDVFGYPEVGVEACRLLSESFYNIENYKKVDVDENYFQIDDFYEYYLLFAEKSKDKKAYYHALNQKKFILGTRFEYTSIFESDYDLDTERMWKEIKRLFVKIDEVTKQTKNSLINEIEENPYISSKYKNILICCLNRPLTMFDQYGMIDDGLHLGQLLNHSDSVLHNSIDKLEDDLNMVEKIYVYSEICYQYILKENKEMYLKFSKQFANELENLKDYHHQFDYLSMIAIQKYLELSQFLTQNSHIEDRTFILEGYHYITQSLLKYICHRWENFDYFMMQMSYRGIALTYCIEAIYGQSKKYDEELEKLTERKKYLEKIWIGEDHIVNEYRDANADCKGRLDGVFTKERQAKYIERVNELIDLWKDEEHSREEYQQKYHEIFDECFPFPEFYKDVNDFDEIINDKFCKQMDSIQKQKEEAESKGERCIIKIGDELMEL